MVYPFFDDTPKESWNDLKTYIPDNEKFRERYADTKALDNTDYQDVERAIPDNTDHRPEVIEAQIAPTASLIVFDINPAQVGNTVTVTADKGLSDIVRIKIGSVAVVTFTVVSDTELTMVVPAGALTGTVAFTNNTETINATTQLKIAVLPTAADIHFTPTSGAVGATITVAADQGMSTVTGISVNGTSVVTFTITNDTGLTFVIPAGATTGTVSFTNPAGTVTSVDTLTVS